MSYFWNMTLRIWACFFFDDAFIINLIFIISKTWNIDNGRKMTLQWSLVMSWCVMVNIEYDMVMSEKFNSSSSKNDHMLYNVLKCNTMFQFSLYITIRWDHPWFSFMILIVYVSSSIYCFHLKWVSNKL